MLTMLLRLGLVLCVALSAACPARSRDGGGSSEAVTPGAETKSPGPTLPAEPRARASKEFHEHWGDGKAELSGYRVTLMRYGMKREGSVVLIYVTEPMDRRTWIKDDQGDVARRWRVGVLKLNQMARFQTGIYPYAVMTSVFAPYDDYGRERFFPAKIALSVQEWCGHVYHQVRPDDGRFFSAIRSYFSVEGDRDEWVDTAVGALYEDALLIQLRELDGPFNGGKDWQGKLVPALWSARKAHTTLEPVGATIARSDATREGLAVTRFVVAYQGYQRTIDIERAMPHRVLGWSSSDGEQAELLKTARLPYWQLNNPGDEHYREQLGLEPGGER